MHRLQVLYALPQRSGYSWHIHKLQYDVHRVEGIRMDALFPSCRPLGRAVIRLSVHQVRQMRTALSSMHSHQRETPGSGSRSTSMVHKTPGQVRPEVFSSHLKSVKVQWNSKAFFSFHRNEIGRKTISLSFIYQRYGSEKTIAGR